jgi:uncharacterized protein (DUF1330 family)
MTTLDQDTVTSFLVAGDGPVVMLNLLRFTEDGGRETYRRYLQMARPSLERHGAEIVYSGLTDGAIVAEAGQSWDGVALVRYPSRQAFLDLVADPGYAEADALRLKATAEITLQPTAALDLDGGAAG